MLFNRNTFFLLALTISFHCGSTQIKRPEPTPYRTVEIERFVSSRVGLKLRTHFNLDAPVVAILPLNTKLSCSLETNFPEKIDSKMAPWLYCSSRKGSGWLFAGYTEEELSIEPKKDNLLQSLGNDTAVIEVILLKKGLFRIRFLNILTPNNVTQEFSGRWSLIKETLTLVFEGENTGENALFFLSPNQPITDIGNPITHVKDRVYNIELTEPTIFIWGVRCAVKKVDN